MERHTNKQASMQVMICRQKSNGCFQCIRLTETKSHSSSGERIQLEMKKIIDNVVRKMLFTSMNFMYRCYCRSAVVKRFPRISVVAARMWNTATLTMWQFVCVCCYMIFDGISYHLDFMRKNDGSTISVEQKRQQQKKHSAYMHIKWTKKKQLD